MLIKWIWPIAFATQGLAMIWDEFYFHRKRGLPRWERIGHPLDTLGFLLCIGVATFCTWTAFHLGWFLALALVSCILITKDEWVHAEKCLPEENWLHSILFILHPISLFCTAVLWYAASANNSLHLTIFPFLPTQDKAQFFLSFQFGIITLFGIYQTVYWNFLVEKNTHQHSRINNSCYNDLGERWYQAEDDPIALLRAESRLRNPWILAEIQSRFEAKSCSVLDIACGAGFLSNSLAKVGLQVTGVDISRESLAVAKSYDSTQSVRYLEMSADRLDFPDHSFDVVCAMDFLEHIENPQIIIKEVARMLKPGGIFFFHTFDRNPLSWLVVIKGVEWFVKNTPKKMHIYSLFVKPREMHQYCIQVGLDVQKFRGTRPKIGNRAFWKLLATGKVSPDFEFTFTSSLANGYSGFAARASLPSPDSP